jgi:hypothetical protein
MFLFSYLFVVVIISVMSMIAWSTILGDQAIESIQPAPLRWLVLVTIFPADMLLRIIFFICDGAKDMIKEGEVSEDTYDIIGSIPSDYAKGFSGTVADD